MRYDALSTYLAHVCLGFLGFSIQDRGLYLASLNVVGDKKDWREDLPLVSRYGVEYPSTPY